MKRAKAQNKRLKRSSIMGQIKKVAYADRYLELKEASMAAGEKNDCAVVAVATVAGIEYNEALELMTKAGRKPRDGTFISVTKEVLESLDIKIKLVDKRKYLRRCKTFPKAEPKNITSHSFRRFPDAWHDLHPTCLAFTTDHVFAVINSQNVDYSVNRKIRITQLYEVHFGPSYDEKEG
jgi:hypothetical protein